MIDDFRSTPEIDQLWKELTLIFNSNYGESLSDLREAKKMLHNAVVVDNVPVDMLKTKCKQAAERLGEYKGKLSTIIIGRYWTKTYRKNIEYIPFYLEDK